MITNTLQNRALGTDTAPAEERKPIELDGETEPATLAPLRCNDPRTLVGRNPIGAPMIWENDGAGWDTNGWTD